MRWAIRDERTISSHVVKSGPGPPETLRALIKVPSLGRIRLVINLLKNLLLASTLCLEDLDNRVGPRPIKAPGFLVEPLDEIIWHPEED